MNLKTEPSHTWSNTDRIEEKYRPLNYNVWRLQYLIFQMGRAAKSESQQGNRMFEQQYKPTRSHRNSVTSTEQEWYIHSSQMHIGHFPGYAKCLAIKEASITFIKKLKLTPEICLQSTIK